VLIAASRKDRVQDRQGLAEAAGLVPVVLDIESHIPSGHRPDHFGPAGQGQGCAGGLV
jgi:hypothetical protein